MRHFSALACFVAALLAGHARAAPPADPMSSEHCQTALSGLRSEEDAALSAPGDRTGSAAPHPALMAARQRVAQACLGGSADLPLPQRLGIPPTAFRAVVLDADRPPAAPAAAPSFRALAPITAPVALTGCDPTGCWASDGSRLQRAGPTLLGPHGSCSLPGAIVAGSLVHCP